MPVMSGESNGEIRKGKLLLVEGKDEENFFNALLKQISNTEKSSIIEDIQIINIGGIGELKKELGALLNRTGFSENVVSMAIVRDADGNFESAFQSVRDLLTRQTLPVPSERNTYVENDEIKVGVFIMPGCPEDGNMLENLCLKTQCENPIMECIYNYLNCLGDKGIDMPTNISKTKSQIFLASMPKIVNNLGLGAQRGYWDLTHDSLWEIKDFLKNL